LAASMDSRDKTLDTPIRPRAVPTRVKNRPVHIRPRHQAVTNHPIASKRLAHRPTTLRHPTSQQTSPILLRQANSTSNNNNKAHTDQRPRTHRLPINNTKTTPHLHQANRQQISTARRHTGDRNILEVTDSRSTRVLRPEDTVTRNTRRRRGNRPTRSSPVTVHRADSSTQGSRITDAAVNGFRQGDVCKRLNGLSVGLFRCFALGD